MDETAAKTFEGYEPSDRLFSVTGYTLALTRRWLHDRFDVVGTPGCSVWISGIAVSPDADGSVIGRDLDSEVFELFIYSDRDAYSKLWGDASIDERWSENSPEERQFLERRNNDLKKIPPTAMLFTFRGDGGAEIPRQARWLWRLNCEIPEPIISALADAIASGSINSVKIEIRWVGGVAKDRLVGTTWGLFAPSKRGLLGGLAEPEPLFGHVTNVGWTPGQKVLPPDWFNDSLGKVCEHWFGQFQKEAEDSNEL